MAQACPDRCCAADSGSPCEREKETLVSLQPLARYESLHPATPVSPIGKSGSKNNNKTRTKLRIERDVAPAAKVSAELYQRWCNYAYALAIFTVVYNLAEGVVSIYWGGDDDSASLFGFGLGSLIEVASAMIVWYHLRKELKPRKGRKKKADASLFSLKAERRMTLLIGGLLLLLCFSAIAGGVIRLVSHQGPESTFAGILISATALAFMFFLWYYKTKAAVLLDSSSLTSDANCSFGCIKLSSVLLIGSIIFQFDESLWWVDAATVIVIGLFVGHEGYLTAKGALAEDFSGGCGCCSGSDSFLAKSLRSKIEASNMELLVKKSACGSASGCGSGTGSGCGPNCGGPCCSGRKAVTKTKKKSCCTEKAKKPSKGKGKGACCASKSACCPEDEADDEKVGVVVVGDVLSEEKKEKKGGCCSTAPQKLLEECKEDGSDEACRGGKGSGCCGGGGGGSGTRVDGSDGSDGSKGSEDQRYGDEETPPKAGGCCSGGHCSSQLSG